MTAFLQLGVEQLSLKESAEKNFAGLIEKVDKFKALRLS